MSILFLQFLLCLLQLGGTFFVLSFFVFVVVARPLLCVDVSYHRQQKGNSYFLSLLLRE